MRRWTILTVLVLGIAGLWQQVHNNEGLKLPAVGSHEQGPRPSARGLTEEKPL
jgi:hypothetical protein